MSKLVNSACLWRKKLNFHFLLSLFSGIAEAECPFLHHEASFTALSSLFSPVRTTNTGTSCFIRKTKSKWKSWFGRILDSVGRHERSICDFYRTLNYINWEFGLSIFGWSLAHLCVDSLCSFSVAHCRFHHILDWRGLMCKKESFAHGIFLHDISWHII